MKTILYTLCSKQKQREWSRHICPGLRKDTSTRSKRNYQNRFVWKNALDSNAKVLLPGNMMYESVSVLWLSHWLNQNTTMGIRKLAQRRLQRVVWLINRVDCSFSILVFQPGNCLQSPRGFQFNRLEATLYSFICLENKDFYFEQ